MGGYRSWRSPSQRGPILLVNVAPSCSRRCRKVEISATLQHADTLNSTRVINSYTSAHTRQVCWALVTVRWSDPCLTLRALHGGATGAIWIMVRRILCTRLFGSSALSFSQSAKTGGYRTPKFVISYTQPNRGGQTQAPGTRAPPPREVAARISRRPFYTPDSTAAGWRCTSSQKREGATTCCHGARGERPFAYRCRRWGRHRHGVARQLCYHLRHRTVGHLVERGRGRGMGRGCGCE